VIAIRDTSVLVLTRTAYQVLAEEARRSSRRCSRRWRGDSPRSRAHHACSRIAEGTNRGTDRRRREPVPGAFDRRMREGLAAIDAEIVDPARLNAMFPGRGWMRPSHRLAQQTRTRRTAGGLSRRPPSVALGRARLSARPTWSCSRAVEMRPRER